MREDEKDVQDSISLMVLTHSYPALVATGQSSWPKLHLPKGISDLRLGMAGSILSRGTGLGLLEGQVYSLAR
jgi:hypothetical protein